jgi:hypothetical protein
MKWYKHFSKMRLDIKIKRLLDKYGIIGYGVYNYVLECIAFRLDPENPVPEIEENCNDLAKEMQIDTIKLEEIINFCIKEKLFEINPENNRIMCLKLLNHLDNTLSNNPEIKNILSNFNKLEGTSSNLKQIRLDKIRLEEININNSNELFPISENQEIPIKTIKHLNKQIKPKKEQKIYFTKYSGNEMKTLFNEAFKMYCNQEPNCFNYDWINFWKIIDIFQKEFPERWKNQADEFFLDLFSAIEHIGSIYDSQLEIYKVMPRPSIIYKYINEIKQIINLTIAKEERYKDDHRRT